MSDVPPTPRPPLHARLLRGLQRHESERCGLEALPTLPARFVVERALGAGGMGVVIAAHDLALNRAVAIKVRRVPAGEDPAARTRFQREAQALARLRHPGIVAIHELLELPGADGLVMDRVVGETLQRRLQRDAPLPIDEVLRWGRALADALQHAHDHHVLHRDVKPANVLIDVAGRVRLVDFGLALLTLSDATRLTRTGAVLGTPGFMAPEQATGGRVDARADVYGLGATLFALLTGCAPDAHPPSARALRPDLPVRLARVLARALDPDPSRRFQRPADLGAALASTPPRPLRWVLSSLAVAAGALALWAAPATTSPTAPSLASLPTASAENVRPKRPEWYRAVPTELRPPWPLPSGLSPGNPPGAWINNADGSRLVWVEEVGCYVGCYEVRRDQYWRFVDATEDATEPTFGDRNQYPNHPMTMVDAVNARAYCTWAQGRLPTLEEWRATLRRWGARAPVNARGESDPWAYTCAVDETTTPLNGPSCLHLVGNVWEWTASGEVVVGGGFETPERRVHRRQDDLIQAVVPTDRQPDLGFRVVRDP